MFYTIIKVFIKTGCIHLLNLLYGFQNSRYNIIYFSDLVNSILRNYCSSQKYTNLKY